MVAGRGMRCAATPATHKGRYAERSITYCIDAREPGKPCGPRAALFTPKEKTPCLPD